jgi:hypothetical protein
MSALGRKRTFGAVAIFALSYLELTCLAPPHGGAAEWQIINPSGCALKFGQKTPRTT